MFVSVFFQTMPFYMLFFKLFIYFVNERNMSSILRKLLKSKNINEFRNRKLIEKSLEINQNLS